MAELDDTTEPRFNPETDRDALIVLYEATGGDAYEDLEAWLNADRDDVPPIADRDDVPPIADRGGVFTNAAGRVTHLDLDFRTFNGELPPELGTLTELTYLRLEGSFTGRIPAELGQLGQLQHLELSGNRLTGEIPAELGELSQLQYLDLSENALEGEIPAALAELLAELDEDGELEYLDLSGNALGTSELMAKAVSETDRDTLIAIYEAVSSDGRGELDASVSKSDDYWLDGDWTNRDWPSDDWDDHRNHNHNRQGGNWASALTNAADRVTHLVLELGLFWGELPPELGTLTQLTHLRVQGLFTGKLPTQLGDLTHLEVLDLRGELTGTVPAELGKLSQLVHLDLSGNELTGEIPADLGKLGQLVHLDLSGNELTGKIPADLGKLGKIEYLDLGGNRLTGQIPAALGDLRELLYLEFRGRNEKLQGGRADLFRLDLRPEVQSSTKNFFDEYRDGYRSLSRTDVHLQPEVQEHEETPSERATFHIFSLHPIELYDLEIARHVATMLGHNGHTIVDHGDHSLPFGLKLLSDLDMTPQQMFEGPYKNIGGQPVYEYAALIGTTLCIIYHATPKLHTSDPDDTRMYERIKWALSVAAEPPEWVSDALPHNSIGALYRAAWIWIHQRYIWSRWTHNAGDDAASPAQHETIHYFARDNEERIETQLGTLLEKDEKLMEIVRLIKGDEPRIFTFSALEIEAEGRDGPLGPLWWEHFPTTSYALDVLEALDDGLRVSREALDGFEGHGTYRSLQRVHIYLRDLMSSEALANPSESLHGQRFQDVTEQLVGELSKLDLEQVRDVLAKRQPMNRGADAVKSDWLDVQDGDEHLFVQAEPDLVTIATANRSHIDDIVAMEVALQSGWNSFARAAGRVLSAHKKRDDQPAGGGDREASEEEDALLDVLSDQLLRVTRWRAQVFGWRHPVFERLRKASGLDANIDAFYKASEESVKRSEVLRQNARARREEAQAWREEARARRERKFQAALGVGALALAAVVLGEIAISIEGKTEGAAAKAAAWFVGLGIVLIAWVIAKLLSDQSPERLTRTVGWFWNRSSETIAALSLAAVIVAFLALSLGLPTMTTWLLAAGLLTALFVALVVGLALDGERAWRFEVLAGIFAGAALAWALWDFLNATLPRGVWIGVAILEGGAVTVVILACWAAQSIADPAQPPTA